VNDLSLNWCFAVSQRPEAGVGRQSLSNNPLATQNHCFDCSEYRFSSYRDPTPQPIWLLLLFKSILES
jgi:hypothetical protein